MQMDYEDIIITIPKFLNIDADVYRAKITEIVISGHKESGRFFAPRISAR